MNSRDFVYWLQGYFEIMEAGGQRPSLTPEQVEIIKKHLQLVFVHEIDPSMGPQEHQDKLNEIHSPPLKPFLPYQWPQTDSVSGPMPEKDGWITRC